MKAANRHKVPFMSQPMLIAAKEFGDRFRSGWVIACVVVWLGAIGLTSFLGLLQVGQIRVQGYDRTVISLLNLVQYLVPLLGLLLGHDLIVAEKEERTLGLLLAGGVSRTRFLIGKFLGGCLTLAVPLLLGFIIAGTVIGLAAKDAGIAPFLRLAVSGLILGTIFLAMGLAISVALPHARAIPGRCLVGVVFCRIRVRFDCAGFLRFHQSVRSRARNRICVRRDSCQFGCRSSFRFQQRRGRTNSPQKSEPGYGTRLAGHQPN